jgi:hypothetical protein
MKRWIVIVLLLMGGVVRFTGSASAQFYPGYGYGGSGWDGSAALLGADSRQAQVIQSRAESRLAGQQLAAQQNNVIQSGIRNTLSGQAQSRDAAIQAQQQANQDWWFQHQQQQMAQRPPANYATAAMPLQDWGSLAPPSPPPPASMDLIKWPTLLQAPCFAADREKIEAPYRHTPPEGWDKLSTDDYRQIGAAVEDMKALLQWRSSEGVDTNAFTAAKNFLIQMSDELAKRIHPEKTSLTP